MNKKNNNRMFESILVHSRQIVKNRPLLGCILKTILRIRTREFQEYVARYVPPTKISTKIVYERSLVLTAMGRKNSDKIIVWTEHDSNSGGFCAQWVFFLNRLSFSDKYKFYHFINWFDSQFYKEKKEIMDTDNIFEYFFEQPQKLSIEEVKKSYNVIIDNNSIDYGFYDTYAPGREDDYIFLKKDIEKFAFIQNKYIKLKREIQEEIDKSIKEIIGDKRVLAVHARGADSKLPYNRHPVPVEIKEYIRYTKMAMKYINATFIFLATDDNSILTAFLREFKDKLLYYKDVERSDGTRMNCYGESKREKHHYRLGLEIIRDVYTMASCTGFVCGMSYVGYIVQVIKKSQKERFEILYQIKTKLRKRGWNLRDPNVLKTVEDIWNKEINSRR